MIFHFFSNALGILAYTYLNNILYKEHVISGENKLILSLLHWKSAVSFYWKILKTSNGQKSIVWTG